MISYSNLCDRMREKGIELEPLSPELIDSLGAQYAHIPSDYLEFLRTVGFGAVGGYVVFSGPVPPEDIFDPTDACGLGGTLLFGTDGIGDCYGFDTAGNVVRVDHVDVTEHSVGESFGKYIKDELMSWLSD